MAKKNGISSKKYYELLEWKDENLKEFQEMKGEGARLCDLTPYQLNKLYEAIFIYNGEERKVPQTNIHANIPVIKVGNGYVATGMDKLEE